MKERIKELESQLSAVPTQPTKTIAELKEGLFGWASDIGGMDGALAQFADRVIKTQQPAQEPVSESQNKLEELLDEYFDLAYEKGREFSRNGLEANRVRKEILELFKSAPGGGKP